MIIFVKNTHKISKRRKSYNKKYHNWKNKESNIKF